MNGSNSEGYYRYPTLRGDQVVFVSEDDLWTVPLGGGVARRLSSGLGKVSAPSLSSDGQWLAFTSTEEGHPEVFVMPADGGEATRLTYLGSETKVIGWTTAGEIVFASNHQHAFARLTDIYKLSLDHRDFSRIPCGPATHLDFDQNERMVISRRGGTDLAYWKRYRGGTAGELWIDRVGDGSFTKLLKVPANAARPFWVGGKIYFISDHEGHGNIYSVKEDGTQLKRHTNAREFYVRGLAKDDHRLIYFAGADLYVLDVSRTRNEPEKVQIDYRSPKTQLNRRFVSAVRYLEDFDLHPTEEKAVIAARGKIFSFDLWRGPVFMHGEEGAIRYRLAHFMTDGKRIALIGDACGEEALEIHDAENRKVLERFTDFELGRVLDMKLSPTRDELVIANHRNELIWVDLTKKTSKIIDRSEYSRITAFNWSPDGRYVAYSTSFTARRFGIKIYDLEKQVSHIATDPVLVDTKPFFDPDGEYLYFLSYREFDPVYDNLHFDLGFPRGCRPCLVTLRKDTLSPFSMDHSGRAKSKDKKDSSGSEGETKSEAEKTIIDFDGLTDRIVAFPVPDGRYGQIAATREKVYFTRDSIKGSLSSNWRSREPAADTQLEMFDLETEKTEVISANMTSFALSRDGKFVIYRAGNDLRVIKANEKPSRDSEDYRKGGWLDLKRVQIPVLPREEWRQMYSEAWRLQRDHFWIENMAQVNWQRVYERYLPLLERVGSRSEVSDLIWEMQGELGTSHAYEIGGDYRLDPNYGLGFLGVDFKFDEKENAYQLTRVLRGDLWDESSSSPLARAGLNLKEGDYLFAIDGQPLSRDHKPHQCLIHKAGREVAVSFRHHGSEKIQTLAVKALHSEQKLRYRDWVERNRQYVKDKSSGQVGYIHIPNMGPFGYSEFHRSFLTELDCHGLIIDVRFNGGGHVSQLLLEKLTRRRIAYSKSRWYGVSPYPLESPQGPMVALTNEYAGSDGDIFSHAFKLMKLGPLIGKRTWGGVIGVSPSHSLVDGGMTTQPEFSFWFEDVGWRVENYGTDPDTEIDIEPADFVAGLDPQLDLGLKICLERVDQARPVVPKFEQYPDLSLPE